jgi:anti-anti-sigma regulatory factor
LIRLDVKEENEKTIVYLEGNATIEHTEEIQQQLLERMKNASHIELSMNNVEKVDVAFLQIVEALCKSAVKQEKQLSLSQDSLTPVVQNAIYTAGFFRQKRCLLDHEKPCLLNQSLQEGVQ